MLCNILSLKQITARVFRPAEYGIKWCGARVLILLQCLCKYIVNRSKSEVRRVIVALVIALIVKAGLRIRIVEIRKSFSY